MDTRQKLPQGGGQAWKPSNPVTIAKSTKTPGKQQRCCRRKLAPKWQMERGSREGLGGAEGTGRRAGGRRQSSRPGCLVPAQACCGGPRRGARCPTSPRHPFHQGFHGPWAKKGLNKTFNFSGLLPSRDGKRPSPQTSQEGRPRLTKVVQWPNLPPFPTP